MEEFNFMSEDKMKVKTSKIKIATSGNQGEITPEIKAEAIKLAESPEGLDIAKFQKKHKLHIMNIDEILKG